MKGNFALRLAEEEFPASSSIDQEKMKVQKKGDRFNASSVESEILRKIMPGTPYVKVVGVGGAGSNAVSRIKVDSITETETIVMNTDARHLLGCNANKKVILGYELTEGLGAGNDPLVGQAAAEESYKDLLEVLENTKMVFLTCGLGGGTGTGAIPVVAKAAKEVGALVVSVVTLPFKTEGAVRTNNAFRGLRELDKYSDAVIIVPNEKLLIFAPNLSLNRAFRIADQILVHAVVGIAELVTNSGFVNVDFGDVRKILGGKGPSVIGFGEAEGENRVQFALSEALSNPLLDVDISRTKYALVFVVGGESLELSEVDQIISAISKEIDPSAEIIWGASIVPDIGKRIRITLCLAGVQSPYLEVRSERNLTDELWEAMDTGEEIENAWISENHNNEAI